MANYNDQVIQLWNEWISLIGAESADPADFIEWALINRRLAPNPQEISKLLRKQVTQVLRQAKRYDEEGGFAYRAWQSVTLFANGIPTKHYFDTDTGGTTTLRQKSTRQRREAIAHHVYRGACDVERMNKVHSSDPQLSFVLDFTDDVAELRAADNSAGYEEEEIA